ncbi:MAG: LD-carboxypeptidase [Planctomycetota bacterium]
MNFPNVLQQNSTLGLLALSGPAPTEKILAGIELLKQLGFRIKIGESVFAKKGYLAGSAQLRAHDFIQMWQDPEIDAIFCTRGGYGSMQVIPLIPTHIFSQPKIILGCSDLTAFFLFLQKYQICCVHGPFVAGDQMLLSENQQALLKLFCQGEISPLLTQRTSVFQEGMVRGEIVGGNLTMISHSLGTPYEIETEHKILFLEDIGEKPYRIDRMMHQLLHSDKLSKLRGIVLGDFVECGSESELKKFFTEFFQEHLIPHSPEIPIIFGLQAGHGRLNTAFPLGYPLKIIARNHQVRIQLFQPNYSFVK